MLKDVLQTFAKEYEKHGEKLITDNYKLDDGTYILVSNDGTIKAENILEINKKNYDEINSKKFVEMDYLSKLLEMNKPIDSSKTIHSNNYLAFWIKKNKISEKLNTDIINEYYKILLNPKLKYSKNLEPYVAIEKEIGIPDEIKIEKYKEWIKENIFTLITQYKIKVDKSYLKIYFEGEIEEYERENKRYIIPNIYNSSDYNIKINGNICGMPNDNIGLNAKKPYLENKNRKISTPYLISQEEVMLQKRFFDYLLNLLNNKKTNIYVDENKISSLDNVELLDRNFSGFFIKIIKGKEVEIHDFDTITCYTPKLKEFKITQVIPVDSVNHDIKRENLVYEKIEELKELQNYINILFFNKFLVGNYFSDVKEVRLNDGILKEELVKSRMAYFNWFYKGNKKTIKSIFEKSSIKIIKNSISKGQNFKGLEQFNLREAMLKYFGGDRKMAERLDTVNINLRQKTRSKDMCSIISDDEYYFAIGQISYFLLSKSKSSSNKQSLINPIINCGNIELLLAKLKGLYKKYNYDIDNGFMRFNNLYGMILRYIPYEKKVNDDVLLAGFLCKNLIYEKEENSEEK